MDARRRELHRQGLAEGRQADGSFRYIAPEVAAPPEDSWVEMRPIRDAVRFADEDEPGFDRARAWRAVFAGTYDVELGDVRIDEVAGSKYVAGLGRVRVVRWSMRERAALARATR